MQEVEGETVLSVVLDVSVARKRKKEKQRQRRSMVPTLSNEELMESPTFKKFTSCMEYAFDTAEDANLAALDISKLGQFATFDISKLDQLVTLDISKLDRLVTLVSVSWTS